MSVGQGDADVGEARSVADLGKCIATGQGVADEHVAAVVDRERLQPLSAQHLAGGAEPLAEGVAG